MDSIKKLVSMSRQMSTESRLKGDNDVESAKLAMTTERQLSRPHDLLLQRLTSVEERNHCRKMQQLFQLLDTNQDGFLDIPELHNHLRNHKCKNLPEILVSRVLKTPDEEIVFLNFEEFYTLSQRQEWFPVSRFVTRYCEMVVPSPGRNDATGNGDCPFAGISFESLEPFGSNDKSNGILISGICPPPLTMIIFSFLEIIMFLYDVVYFSEDPRNDKKLGENIDGPAATLFIYNTSRRYEIWRFVTYMFVHVGVSHLIMNLIVQIFLGIALELVHQWWRVALVYLAGVIAGSMGTSIFNPGVALAGASGGVYALITAHIATVIMNWAEMEYAILQLFVFLVFSITDLGLSTIRHINNYQNQVGYVAHLCGAVAGLLVGIFVLRNLKVHQWEKKLWWFAVTLYVLLMLTGISLHLFYSDHFSLERTNNRIY